MHQECVSGQLLWALHAPRKCFWSVALGFICTKSMFLALHAPSQLLLALCTKSMFLVSCSWLYMQEEYMHLSEQLLSALCTQSIFLASCSWLYMHQEYVSGQLLLALCTRVFFVSCYRLYMHQECVSGQLLSALHAPRMCFWSVALGFTCTKNVFLVSCTRLYMHQECVSGQLHSALHAPRMCFWSVALGFTCTKNVSGQLLSALCTKNVPLDSCTWLYIHQECFWSVALGLCTKTVLLISCSRIFHQECVSGQLHLAFIMHQEYVSGQLLWGLHAPRICFWSVALGFTCTKKMFLDSCSRL